MKSFLAVLVVMFSLGWVASVQASPYSPVGGTVSAHYSDGYGVHVGYRVHRSHGHHGDRYRHGRHYRHGSRYYRSRSYYPAGFYSGYRGRYCR